MRQPVIIASVAALLAVAAMDAPPGREPAAVWPSITWPPEHARQPSLFTPEASDQNNRVYLTKPYTMMILVPGGCDPMADFPGTNEYDNCVIDPNSLKQPM